MIRAPYRNRFRARTPAVAAAMLLLCTMVFAQDEGPDEAVTLTAADGESTAKGKIQPKWALRHKPKN